MFRKIVLSALAVIVVVVAGILVFATTRPDSFRVTRSTAIKAPPERVAALLTDFRGWVDWSPWEKIDPALKRTYSGASKGKGAIYEWEGNSEVGQGRMEIADATSSRVLIKLDFVKPMEGHNVVEFKLEPQSDMTKITWDMQGEMNFVSKVVTIFCDMDSMIGGFFETGLTNLKKLAEK